MRGWAPIALTLLLAGCAGPAKPLGDDALASQNEGVGAPAEPLLVPMVPARAALAPPDAIEFPVPGGQAVVLMGDFGPPVGYMSLGYAPTANDQAARAGFVVLREDQLGASADACKDAPAGMFHRFISAGGIASVNSNPPLEGAYAMVFAASHAGVITIRASNDLVGTTPATTKVSATPLQGPAAFTLPDMEGSGLFTGGVAFEAPVEVSAPSLFLANFSVFETAQAGTFRIEETLALADETGCSQASEEGISVAALVTYNAPAAPLATRVGPGAYQWSGRYQPSVPSFQPFPEAHALVLSWPPATILVPAAPTQTA